MTNEEKSLRIRYLVDYLKKRSDEYYNQNSPTISDAQYDKLFDELSALEKETGIVLATSPTQKVGSEVLSELEKVIHVIPLLSLAKTKSTTDIKDMLNKGDGYLALKIDGLTVELLYQNGTLTEASTRGDGTVGELITHNAKVFKDIPLTIPFKEKLRVTGEAYIDIQTFDSINEKIENDEDKYSTPRNLAAGSVRQLDSNICKEREVCFMPFNVLEGMEATASRTERLNILSSYGFSRIPSFNLKTEDSTKKIEEKITTLKNKAFENGLPIDGIVFFYDDAVFSATLGRTAHHFRDGIAYKFGDPHFKTVLNSIEWNISRTGQLTPVAIFSPIEIDNTIVERASLHNMTFIKDLKLKNGDSIMVSKRNMIIPHVEENLSSNSDEEFVLSYPEFCPVCNHKTQIQTTENGDRIIEVLYCKNPDCAGKNVKKFTHFVSKQALNIDGLSEQTVEKFIKNGWLHNVSDIFKLYNFRDEITTLDGFGEKSFNNLINAIENAKSTTLSNLLVAMNIDLIGKSGAKLIEDYFQGDALKLLNEIDTGFNFTVIEGFGDIMSNSVTEWFNNTDNRNEFLNVLSYLTVKKPENNSSTESIFFGKRIVITGTFDSFTRDELSEKLTNLGAKVSGSVSSKTDFLLCGESAGSKLEKARALSVTILNEEEILNELKK